jgi:hypothetical protein
MKTSALLAVLILLTACTGFRRDEMARSSARAECNRILDHADRDRCMGRVDEMYGNAGLAERRDPPKR